MSFIDIYIYFVLFIKLLFFILIIIFTNRKKRNEDINENNNSKYDVYIKDFEYAKNRFEFIFIFLMAILLIVIFNPLVDQNIMINKHTKLLLFIYGIIILINAEWKEFINTSYIYKRLSQI